MALAQNKSREFVVAEGDKRCCSGKEMGNSHKWATATTVRSLTQDCGRGNVKETVICPTPGGLVERQSSGPELPSRVNTNHRPSRRPESVPRLPPNCGKSSTHFIPECLHGNMRLFDVDPSSDFIINSYKYESSSDTSSKRLLIGDKTIKTMATYKSVDRLREHRSVSNGKKNGKDEDYESDSSEELQYGPGIVNKLKTKYLSLTLRENQRRGVRPSLNNLRRAASLENILDEEAKVSQTKTPTYFKKSTHNATVSKNSKVSQYCARYMNINKGSDSMKRAQSMDALFRNEVKSVPCSLTKSLTVDARLSNGNDVVIIDRAPQPPKVPPKPDVDKDLPPPDVVKQTLKIFEKSTTSPRKPDVSIVPKVKAVKVIQERPKAPVDKRRPLVKPSVLPKPVLSSDRFSQNKKEPVPCSTPDKIAPQPCFVFMKDLEVPDVSPIRKETLAEATNTLVSEPERPAVQQPVAAQRPPPRPVDSPKQVAIIRPVVNKVPVPPKPSSPPPPVSVPSPPQPPVTPPLTHVEIEKNLINRSRTDSPQEDSPKISLWDTKAWNGQNTVVFDFSNRKEIPDYIESDGVTEKKDKKDTDNMVLKEQLAERRTALPVLHVKGSHYDVGYDIGRFFKSIIQDMLDTYQPLINDYLPAYATPEGKEVYNDTLECVRERFPRYIRELEGMAHGAEVPFYKLFLIHIDDILPCAAHGILSHNTNGCSTLCVNEPGAELLGHTEDAFSGALNHCFIVVAEIPESREKFCSFCYAGYLPGYAMNFNQHGLVFTLNIVAAKHMVKARTPRTFLCRRLLACESLSEVETVLRDKGCGAGDGMSVNLTFLNQEGDRLFHNVEVAPALPPSMESPLSILTISPSEQMFHCNKYLRLNIAEAGGPIFASSDARMNAYKSRARPCSRRDLIELLGDRSDPTFTIFRDGPHEVVKTVAVGVFDLIARTWSLYLGNPKYVEPLVVLPLDLN